MNQPTKSKALSSSPAVYPSNSNVTPTHSSAPTIMVLDSAELHRPRLEQIIAHCRATPTWIRNISEVGGARARSRAKVLLIALENELSPNAPVLDAMHALKGSGLTILAFADGVHNWPIRTRCLPLVAGVSNLLDSSRSDFDPELFQLLVQLFQAEARREEDERCIKETMIQAGIIGESQSMMAVFRTVLRVSVLSDLPILLTGETGTGKELFAHAIHALDPKRRSGPFIAVNCGTISAGLAESELFGHRRGAFTGADRDRKGLVRSAHGGILFLDEIGELEDGLQSKLLRMLQEKTVLGVGEDGETSVDVRVIAATNRPLEQMVSEKNFREDLFYRLNVLPIHTPSLRQRLGDIRPLVDYFFEKYRALAPALPLSIEDEFIEALAEAGLPGNVRQLENIVRQALVKKDDNAPLTLADLPPEILQQLSRWRPALRDESDGLPRSVDDRPQASSSQREVTSSVVRLLDGNNWRLNRSLASCEKLFLEAALHKTRGNQSQTARLLGITSRSVYNKVRKYHLNSTVNR